MRSLFWFGCAVLICAAGFVYLAADFASRHPDSLAVRCAHAAHAMSVQCNPVTALTSAGVHAFRTASELMWKALTVANEAPVGLTPRRSLHASRTPPKCKASQPVEVIDLTLVPEAGGKSEGGQEEQEAPPGQVADQPETVSVPPSVIEDGDDVPSTMPPAKDDEQVPASPTTEDLVREQLDATRQHVFELWFDLFQKSTENGDKSVTGDEPPADESAKESKQEASPEDKQIEQPDGEEESESVAPDCREDPNYHKQYPGCPYMGGDPATHHCPPSMSNPAPVRHHKKKVKASPIIDPKPDAEEAEEPSADAVVPFPMDRPPAGDRPRNLGPTPDDDMPRHPEVDTMEFRKSDAKEGEFDSPPF